MSHYIACFGVSFYKLFSPSLWLDDIWLDLFSWVATFWKELLILFTTCSICIMSICNLGLFPILVSMAVLLF